jgi:hypothetical protein
MKIEKNNTTTYITAKKRMGCRAPIVADFLVLITAGFRFFSKIGFSLFRIAVLMLYCKNKNMC